MAENASGQESNSGVQSDSGTATANWSIDERTTATNPDGTTAGPPAAVENDGNDTQSWLNGVVTDEGETTPPSQSPAGLPTITNDVTAGDTAAQGSTAGGDVVEITGTGFTVDSQVTFDGVAAPATIVANSTLIFAVSPAHAAGTVNVTVANADGTSGESPAGAYNYDDSGTSVTDDAPPTPPGGASNNGSSGSASGSQPAWLQSFLDDVRVMALVGQIYAKNVGDTIVAGLAAPPPIRGGFAQLAAPPPDQPIRRADIPGRLQQWGGDTVDRYLIRQGNPGTDMASPLLLGAARAAEQGFKLVGDMVTGDDNAVMSGTAAFGAAAAANTSPIAIPASLERFLLDFSAYLHDRETGSATPDEELEFLELYGQGQSGLLRLQNDLMEFANSADTDSAQRGVQAAPFLETAAGVVILMAAGAEELLVMRGASAVGGETELLPIVNRELVPDSRRVLQNLTTRTNSRLGSNLALSGTVLKDAEIDAAVVPGVARLQYGNALERLVANEIIADPKLDALFEHVGGKGKSDFIGRGLFRGQNFDITTVGQIEAHLFRSGYGEGLIIIIYVRPPTVP